MQEIEIDVVDTTNPLILSRNDKTIAVDYDSDLHKLVMYGDNYDRNPICTIEGEYDIHTIGEYQLTYTVIDSSNNSDSTDISLHVVIKTI